MYWMGIPCFIKLTCWLFVDAISYLHHRVARFPRATLGPSPFGLNHFIHHTQNAKWDAETSAAASSLAGYHGDRRHIFPLNLPPTRGYQKGLLSPSVSLRGQESRLPCCEEPCRICRPHRREDTASDRHGSVGAIHKGKSKCIFFLLCVWMCVPLFASMLANKVSESLFLFSLLLCTRRMFLPVWF